MALKRHCDNPNCTRKKLIGPNDQFFAAVLRESMGEQFATDIEAREYCTKECLCEVLTGEINE